MAKLIYPINVSLDGYMEDDDGNLAWSISDEEIFTFWADFLCSIGTYLYGRRMYEAMVYWETEKPQIPSNFTSGDQPDTLSEFARIWQKAEKIVYSRTLQDVSSARTRIDDEFNPDAIRKLKESSSSDITIGGPHLAKQAISMGLVDELHILIHPIILGGGKRALPDNLNMPLELLSERRFASGVVHLHYRLML
ncbi:dihydrofolate reductase family protein [Jeotgalibaca sp. A127]|uniref:dihydrofolate reductase family protein n=1 Tax=Jeotgalibaca sp. A127 TaxID=3457324 RepID=UPI003FD06418